MGSFQFKILQISKQKTLSVLKCSVCIVSHLPDEDPLKMFAPLLQRPGTVRIEK